MSLFHSQAIREPLHWTLNEENSIDPPARVSVKERPLSLFYHTLPPFFFFYQGSAEFTGSDDLTRCSSGAAR